MTYTVEHIAWQHPEPIGAASWYERHLGFTVARKIDLPPHTHFLADASGRVVVELYNNPRAPLLDYPSLDPLQLHLAFTVPDPVSARDELLAAGATSTPLVPLS
jgi:glyoxylase I family protein